MTPEFVIMDKAVLEKGLTSIRITGVQFKMTDEQGREVIDTSRGCMVEGLDGFFDTTGTVR